MGKPKAAAKQAAAQTTRAPVLPEVVDALPEGFPPGLKLDEVNAFLRAIESGEKTVKSAASLMGKQGAEVYRLAKQYPEFGKAIEESVDIGCLMAEDILRDVKASDRDSAAGANVQFGAIERYLKLKRPKRYNTSAFKPIGEGEDVAAVVGVVLVPMRSDAAGAVQQRAAIDSTATVIERLPIDTAPAPAFKVSADG